MFSVIAYLGSILLANILVSQYHLIHLGWFVFPAGAPVIGLTFSARDFVQRRYGKWKCWIWMGVACLITTAFNPKLAVASFGAFVVAEGADWLIYLALEKRPMSHRILTSNLISTPLDSAVFVVLAFGWSWPPIIGQAIIKFACSLLVLPFLRSYKQVH
jgi:uncharacterized PurR-regulated membrane protein YhhQ (DUF165 family)